MNSTTSSSTTSTSSSTNPTTSSSTTSSSATTSTTNSPTTPTRSCSTTSTTITTRVCTETGENRILSSEGVPPTRPVTLRMPNLNLSSRLETLFVGVMCISISGIENNHADKEKWQGEYTK